MRYINPGFPTMLLLLSSLLPFTQSSVYAFDGFADQVFKFQHKLASSGKVQSQYKLGRMYETGRGTSRDIDEAMRWYTRAAEKGFEPAADRITYFEVKQAGYSEEKYGAWVEQVKASASSRVPESMQLLSQMYRDGVGVRKDENKALELLVMLSMDGSSEVDADIAALESKLAANKKKNKKKKRSTSRIVLKPAPAKAAGDAADTSLAKGSQPSSAAVGSSKQQQALSKRQRYEAVMKQLQEEQRLLEQQQQWAESEE